MKSKGRRNPDHKNAAKLKASKTEDSERNRSLFPGSSDVAEVSSDALNQVKNFFDVTESLLYFQDIPENESVLVSSISKSSQNEVNNSDDFNLNETEHQNFNIGSHKIYCSLKRYSKPPKLPDKEGSSDTFSADKPNNSQNVLNKVEKHKSSKLSHTLRNGIPSSDDKSANRSDVIESKKSVEANSNIDLNVSGRRLLYVKSPAFKQNSAESKNKEFVKPKRKIKKNLKYANSAVIASTSSPTIVALSSAPSVKSATLKIEDKSKTWDLDELKSLDLDKSKTTLDLDESKKIDLLVADALRNADQLQPRIYLSDIFDNTEVFRNQPEFKKNLSYINSMVKKKCIEIGTVNSDKSNAKEGISKIFAATHNVPRNRKRPKSTEKEGNKTSETKFILMNGAQETSCIKIGSVNSDKSTAKDISKIFAAANNVPRSRKSIEKEGIQNSEKKFILMNGAQETVGNCGKNVTSLKAKKLQHLQDMNNNETNTNLPTEQKNISTIPSHSILKKGRIRKVSEGKESEALKQTLNGVGVPEVSLLDKMGDTKKGREENDIGTKSISPKSMITPEASSLVNGNMYNVECPETPSRSPSGRKKLSLMDMLKRYSEKKDMSSKSNVYNVKPDFIENVLVDSKNRSKKISTGKLLSKKCDKSLSGGDIKCSASLITRRSRKDYSIDSSCINPDKMTRKSGRTISETCIKSTLLESMSSKSPFATPHTTCSQPSGVSEITDDSHQQKHIDCVAKDTTESDDISSKTKKNLKNAISSMLRMQTRTCSNSLNSKDQDISMKEKSSIKSKAIEALTEYEPPSEILLKRRIRSQSAHDSLLLDDETILTKGRKKAINKRIQSSTALDASAVTSSQDKKRKRSASAEPRLLENSTETTSRRVSWGKEPLSKKRCHKRCASVEPKISSPSIDTPLQVQNKRGRRDNSSSKEQKTPSKIQDACDNSPASEGNMFPVPTSSFSTAVSPTLPGGSPFLPIQALQRPSIFFNPANNSLVLGNPFLQVSPHMNQSIYPALNQFVGQPQNTYLLRNPGNVSSLNSFSSPQSLVTYQTRPMLQSSNFQYNNSLNVNSPFTNRTLQPNTALNFPNMNLHVPLARNGRMPIIINSTTSETRTYTDTETLITKPNKQLSFNSLKDIVNSDRKVCTYDMCDSVLRFYTENESVSKVTVKEFYSRSSVANALRPKIIETIPDFDIPPKVEYIFEDAFHESPIRDVVKEYVAFHLDAIYTCPARKDYFVKKAFKYFSFRDCTYLCESFPKDNEEFGLKDMVLFLSCAALLAIFDECKKRNVLS